MLVLETELNPYERAIEFYKQQIKKWTPDRPDLVKAYNDELDHWNKSYSRYLSTVTK